MGGTGAVAQAYLEQSLGAFVFDIARSPLHDFLAAFGFVECLVEARTLEPMGLQHWDTVCNSWVWMVRSVTRRTPQFPLGNVFNEFTAKGNLMVSRMFLKKANQLT